MYGIFSKEKLVGEWFGLWFLIHLECHQFYSFAIFRYFALIRRSSNMVHVSTDWMYIIALNNNNKTKKKKTFCIEMSTCVTNTSGTCVILMLRWKFWFEFYGAEWNGIIENVDGVLSRKIYIVILWTALFWFKHPENRFIFDVVKKIFIPSSWLFWFNHSSTDEKYKLNNEYW